jgi:hypothetical protein
MIAVLLLAVAANPVTVHVRVDGSGYLRFALNAQLMYGSEANLIVRDGVLATADGAVVIPRIHVPPTCFKLGVSLDGHVTGITPSGKTEIGQLVLSMLPDQAGKTGLFKSNLHGVLSNPGDGLAGVIRCAAAAKGALTSKTDSQESAQPLKIAVRQMSEVDSDTITLGDIAVFTGDKDRRSDAQIIELGRTPNLGSSIRLSEGYVATKLKLAGFKPDDYILIVPEGATITRPSQVVTAAQMLEAALNAIRERFDVGVDLKPDTAIPDLKIPKGDLSLSAELGSRTDRSIAVLILADVDGKRVGSRSIIMIPTEDQVGVKVGDQVTIRLIAAGAVVEVNGKVKSAGWVGQKVSVLSDTGSVHTATVISSSLVEVRL